MLANALFSADLVTKEAAETALEAYVDVSVYCSQRSVMHMAAVTYVTRLAVRPTDPFRHLVLHLLFLCAGTDVHLQQPHGSQARAEVA